MTSSESAVVGGTATTEADVLRALYVSWVDRLAANPEMDLEATRDMFEEWHLTTREPEAVTYGEVDAGGIPAVWCIPEGCRTDCVLLYYHGGGFMAGSMHSHRKLAGHLSRAAGIRALIPDYRRAPESAFPAQVEDGVAVYRWLIEEGIRPERIATAGDSAGGNLAITVVLKLRELGEPLPAAIVSLSPFLDTEFSGESMESCAASDALVSRPMCEQMCEAYLASQASPTDPLVNPLHADLGGLPPVYVTAGGHEMLRDDGVRFARLAEQAGVDVELEVAPGMQHVYQFMAGRHSQADDSIRTIGAWLGPRLGGADARMPSRHRAVAR